LTLLINRVSILSTNHYYNLMPKVCAMCGRGTKSSTNISHSNRKTKRTVKANIQTKKLAGVKTNVCAKCIKTISKKK